MVQFYLQFPRSHFIKTKFCQKKFEKLELQNTIILLVQWFAIYNLVNIII